MQQAVLAAPAPQGVHQSLTIGTAVVCMTAAASQLCRGLGSSATASRQQHLVQQVQALQLIQPPVLGSASEPRRPDSSLHARLAPLLTDGLSPKGPGSNDRTASERALNVLTSLPFLLVGCELLRSEDCSRDVRRVGASLVLAGGAACAYHSTEPSGKRVWLRSAFRKLDHWTVSLASAALMYAAAPKGTQLPSLTSLVFVPWRPTAVTLSNISAVELQLLRRAADVPGLRTAYGRHAMVLAAGGACYAGETTAIRHNLAFVHALWHCCAAYAVSTGAKML